MRTILKLLILIIFYTNIAIAEDYFTIDQLIRINFEPTKSKIILFSDKIKIKNVSAIKLEDNTFLLIVSLPNKIASKNKLSYSFVLSDDNNYFTTPFVEIKTLNKNQAYQERIERKNKVLESRIAIFRATQEKLKEENHALENELAERINLSEILKLRSEFETNKRALDFYNKAKQDLEQLLANRNFRNDSKDLPANSRILSQHLTDAAKVTAAAERLSRKKKETALGRFKEQLKAVEEMQQADLATMAKQLLELRKIRNRLENTADSSNQF